MSNQLELRDVHLRYGAFEAVRGVSLTLAKGEIACLLGPSGCGKTSLLRAIAGFENVAAGEVFIHDKLVSSTSRTTPPELRNVGMVFQDFALFPHLNTQDNVAFGLSAMSRQDKIARVQALLQLVGLEGLERAYPHELSGGQQQRVALARAMAPSPEVLLLDEPFSGLDSELREQLAAEVRQILKQAQISAVLVTHDQHEAFAMADTIALLRAGQIAQTDTAYKLYHNPANAFVAGFIGQGSVLKVSANEQGELSNGMGYLEEGQHQWTPGDVFGLLVRPDDVKYSATSTQRLKVIAKTFRGAHYLYELEMPSGANVLCITPSHVDYAVGGQLPIVFDMKHIVILPQ